MRDVAVHEVLPAFGKPAADLFVVVPDGEDCHRAASLLPNATEIHCIPDRPFSAAEQKWLKEGPGLCWDREKIILQLRLVSYCGNILRQRLQAGISYRWWLRVRADVLWHRFPSQQAELHAQGPGMLLFNWMPICQWQAYCDHFAAGPSSLMLRFFDFYHYVLEPRNWPEYDFPQGDKVLRRYWAHDCNYIELILEKYLGGLQVPVRYTRSVCFVRLRQCGQQPMEDYCTEAAPGAYPDDLSKWRHLHLKGMEVLPEQTFPRHYEHDPGLAAKLVDVFHAEQHVLGRPPKIVDLGCGRGSLVGELRSWGHLAVGLDANPLLTATLNEYGVVADITDNLSFTISTAHPRCNFRPHPYRHARGFEFEDAGQSAGKVVDMDPRNQLQDNPLAWVYWINYIAGRCCGQLACVGFDTKGLLKWKLPNREAWGRSDEVWLYEKYQTVPSVEEAQVQTPFKNGPGVLVPVDEGDATMDWVISLDVGEHIAAQSQATFLQNLRRLAGQGLILSWDPLKRPPVEEIEALGFTRDRELEDHLRLFAGIGLRAYLRHSLLAFRRTGALQPASCHVEPVPPSHLCAPALTFGCLDSKRIWIRGHCAGVFRRWNPKSSGVEEAECLLTTTSIHGYDECELPEPPSSEVAVQAKLSSGSSGRMRWKKAAFDCFSGLVPHEHFWNLQGLFMTSMYDSADPLVRLGEGIWDTETCGTLAVAFKLYRLLWAPWAHFVTSLQRVWTSETRFLLTAWEWQRAPHAGWGCLVASVLRAAARRSAALSTFRSRLAGPARRLRRSCGVRWSGKRCQEAMQCTKKVMGQAFARLRRRPFLEMVQDGQNLWRVLASRRHPDGRRCNEVRTPAFRRYLQRLAAWAPESAPESAGRWDDMGRPQVCTEICGDSRMQAAEKFKGFLSGSDQRRTVTDVTACSFALDAFVDFQLIRDLHPMKRMKAFLLSAAILSADAAKIKSWVNESSQADCTPVQSELTKDVTLSYCKSLIVNKVNRGPDAKACFDTDTPHVRKALANFMFNHCGAWYLYDFRDPSSLCWSWTTKGDCFQRSTACKTHKEQGLVAKRHKKLCKAKCLPAQPSLTEKVTRSYCPELVVNNANYGPEAVACKDKDTALVRKAIANKMFHHCGAHYLYDFDNPAGTCYAWSGTCWKQEARCMGHIEQRRMIARKANLCEVPMVAVEGKACDAKPYTFDTAAGCDGWSGLTEEQCMEKCSTHAKAKNCPRKTCRGATFYPKTGWCHLQESCVETKPSDTATAIVDKVPMKDIKGARCSSKPYTFDTTDKSNVCDGWSGLTLNECALKCSGNEQAKNCPQKTCALERNALRTAEESA
ncbi:unnamed protein product [Symbiodinium natans]|uniref:Uncharacterized protein n=1 Tax=Symbiodinium natans TaxID=878477 RepID=A0A812TUV4_9DINO|nr:unnamed protein product [Symbiodinium natans]